MVPGIMAKLKSFELVKSRKLEGCLAGFPEPGQKILKLVEKENRAGHSVLVIGFDDTSS